MTDYDGYIVSFMPGSRGRLISSIVYKMINNVDIPIEFTPFNSAHKLIDEDNLNYMPESENLSGSNDKKQVRWTHLYPKENWSDKIGIILINVDNESLPEILLNAAIKNIFPKLESQLNGSTLSDGDSKFLFKYQLMYPKLDVSVLSDLSKQEQFLRYVAKDGFIHGNMYSMFIDRPTTLGHNINYKNMFDMQDEKYTVLLRLAEYLGVEYNQDIHLEYANYDRDKFNIFQKYCPWFLKEKTV